MTNDTELISGTLTRRQWREVQKALRTRRSFIAKGIREGTAEQADRMMVDAIISHITELLAEGQTVEVGEEA